MACSGLIGSARKACSVLPQSEAFLRHASASGSPVAAPHLAPISWPSALLPPEEDPFLLLESTLRSIEVVLMLRRNLPLRRTWSEQPYGEEEITRLEEEVLPAIRKCLARVDELDQRLLAQHELLVLRCELEAKQHALA
jgi:hypothetical protein